LEEAAEGAAQEGLTVNVHALSGDCGEDVSASAELRHARQVGSTLRARTGSGKNAKMCCNAASTGSTRAFFTTAVLRGGLHERIDDDDENADGDDAEEEDMEKDEGTASAVV
jgi:hypothetical protein